MSPQDAPRTRRAGALRGFVAAGLPGLLAALYAEQFNHAFIDDPYTLWLVLLALPGLVGAAVGALVRGREDHWPLSGALTSAAVLVGLSVDDGLRQLPELELVVVGLDGATWDRIDPMIAAGELPHLAMLREQGATGTMLAHEPMFSPLLWTTLATGVPPEVHGVRGFRVHADHCRVPRFYDIAEASGRRIGVYKWLVSWPPRELIHGGFLVPGWLAPSPETTPPSLSFVKELELSRRLARRRVAARRSTAALAWEGVRQGLRWSTLRDAGLWWLRERLTHPDPDARLAALQLLRVQIDRDVFVAQLQRERPAVATFTDYATDALGHRFWRELAPEQFPDADPARVRRYGWVIPQAYRQGDAVIGELLALLPPGGRLLIASDHGFQAVRDLAGVAPRTDRLEALLPAAVGQVQVARMGTRITLTLTGEDPEAQRVAVEAWLAGTTRGDAPLYRWEAVEGVPDTLALDLLDASATSDELRDGRVRGEPLADWVHPFENHTGEHEAHGVFAAYGPGVTPGARVAIDALDFAPTALAALGLAPDLAMTGAPPAGVWPAAGPAVDWSGVRTDLRYPDAELQGDVPEALLQALGYLDPAP
ncbi:MAG: alkaline phosphatase family protein [Deltaproteobacteria bacterium]|nr:alkaline phosphatase family protein [Deltaproteobacteria bacterium]